IAPTPFKKKIEQEKLDPDTQLPMLDADGKIITEEKTIQIPMYKPVTVFDVSQTEGRPLPQLAHDLSGNVANYDVFMEALRRSSPVPISIEVMGGGMDGYFDLEHQDIAIRKGMSEVQTVSAVIHEMAHALLHNRTKDTEEKTPELSRSTEEVQAESISYAVCAYYGIATGDNSFGYIASWSKDKTLPELRESLEVISKTADGLINDIDRHYAEILKEREAELIAAEPAMAMERLYAVDDRYLHVQRTDTGVDYTIYDKASMKELDGGQLDMEISTLAESALEICNSHGIGQNAPLQVADIGILDELQAAQDAVIAIEPPVQENPEPETDTPADPAISVEARNAYGYTDDAMLPLTKERAMELFERDVPVYLLYGDNTEAMAFEQTEILNHDGIFGIDRADWEAVKEQFPVATENRWQKAFQQNPADSYCIYQLRRDPELAELRFMNSQYLREHGLEPAFDHYEAVYSGSLPSDGSTEARLDDLYMKFNTAHPQDFTGHSLSVSDIVVLKQQGAVSSHYVDSVGFVQFPAFLPDNYLKNAEMSMEDDYGMIDGIINNGPKEQPETKPKAPDLSALFEAARQVVQEDKQVSEPGKKPSVLAMLHAPAPSRSEKTAQTKSAERDLI
ncbi:MAG: DUF4316 domain-containing protein, partial [Clostridia bacterium]|nr:DUF4316 domain-containing protein [Clostridia bacterium]